MNEYREFHRRKLPHLHRLGSTLFVTFRLAGCVPKAILNRYKAEKAQIEHRQERVLAGAASQEWLDFHRSWFKSFEEILHKAETGPRWLSNPEIAKIVLDAFVHRDRKDLDLDAACIMSNHVHAVFRPRLGVDDLERSSDGTLKYRTAAATLSSTMKSLKGYTARMANRHLGRTGQFWEVESYDHKVRSDEEFVRVVRYTLENPVKAGLVSDWRHWPWTYLRSDLQKVF